MPLNIGDAAPDFPIHDVQSGYTYTLQSFAGQVVLVAFMDLVNCQYCHAEAPVLQDVWEDLNQSSCPAPPQFICVGTNESYEAFKAALHQYGITFLATHDADLSIVGKYQVQGVPELYVIDPKGKVCSILRGYLPPPSAQYEAIMEALMGCGVCHEPSHRPDLHAWAAALSVLFGVVQDGGGLGLTPGGKPVPIDPWGPLYRAPAPYRRLLASLAASRMALATEDPRAARDMEVAALRSASSSLKTLLARASRKGETQGRGRTLLAALRKRPK